MFTFDPSKKYSLPTKGLKQNQLDVLYDLIIVHNADLTKKYYDLGDYNQGKYLSQGREIRYRSNEFNMYNDPGDCEQITFGQFITILEQFKPQLKIGGYVAEFHKGYVQVGCTKVTNEQVDEIVKNLIR